ncbi:MAG TPA: contractile injection system tape measure protein [Lacibacter sp.]|jgi:hypothetical protein|nr:contractile injection system tape measure protein [Lacibacter sp.]
MNATTTHSIGKLTFHLKGVDAGKAFAMRQHAVTYLQHDFLRLAEEVFDDFALNDELIFIQRLSIDLQVGDSFDLKKMEYQLSEQIREQVAAQVQQQKKISVQYASDNDQENRTADADLLLQAWAFYLAHGHLPSYISPELWQERLSWWKKTVNQPNELKQFFIQQLQDEQRLKRFLKQSNADEQEWIFDQLHPGLNAVLKKGKIKFNRPVPFSYFESRTYLLYLLADENNALLYNRDQLPAVDWVMLHSELYQRTTKYPNAEIKKAIDKKRPAVPVNEEIIIVHNAGIVLLQPFISTLFHELHLLSEDRKTLVDKDRACALLSFLAADEKQSEVYYPLYKLICGLHPNDFVDANVELTRGQKEECFHLLQQMIVHWPALKQTSVPSLQQSFFQRTGKLSKKEDKWLLQVEQRTKDVLMQFLPWSYSIIRYPWMKQPLFVEWT